MKSFKQHLNELSGAKLGAYMSKSNSDLKKRREHGQEMRKALNKAHPGMNFGAPIDRKTWKRPVSQKLAIKKLSGTARVNAKEDTQLDEISKTAMKNYRAAAKDDFADVGGDHRYMTGYAPKKGSEVHKRMSKRVKGIRTVNRRLAKEGSAPKLKHKEDPIKTMRRQDRENVPPKKKSKPVSRMSGAELRAKFNK